MPGFSGNAALSAGIPMMVPMGPAPNYNGRG